MELKRLEVGSFENNCYIVSCAETGEAVIIDPAAEAQKIIKEIKKKKVKFILITHGHLDHIGALEEIRRETKALVGIHEGDSGLATESRFFSWRWSSPEIREFGDQSYSHPWTYSRRCLLPDREGPFFRRHPIPERPRKHGFARGRLPENSEIHPFKDLHSSQ